MTAKPCVTCVHFVKPEHVYTFPTCAAHKTVVGFYTVKPACKEYEQKAEKREVEE